MALVLTLLVLTLLVLIFTQNDSSQGPTSASDISSSGMDEKSISSLYNQVNYSLNIKRSALVHSNCPSSHLFEHVCLWAGLLHHLHIIIAPPICLSMCVCGLDSSNPRALLAKDILILFPSTEQGGWVLVKRLVSANKKTCRLGFAIGCTWCHKAHRPVTFEWLLIFFLIFFSPPFASCFTYADSCLIWSLVAVRVMLRHCLWMGKCCLCPLPDLHVLAVVTN